MKRALATVLPAVVAALVLMAPETAFALDVATAFQRGTLLLLAFVFAQGLLTALTPCVYPLIPITVSIFGAREGTRGRAAALSATYVLGIATMFSTIGVAVALTGGLFGRLMANAWVLGFVALVFALFAASLFGAFEINLPSSWSERLARVGGRGFSGALGMGLVAGIIAAPCAGPVVGSILAYVGGRGSPALGFLLLFTYGIGMGLPFFLVGTFAMSLPKSGPWLEGVKSVLGIILLATALYLVKDAFPLLKAPLRDTSGFIGGAIALAAAGILLGGVHKSFHGGWGERLRKGAGVAAVVAGLYGSVAAAALPKSDRAWLRDEPAALARARAEGRAVLVDFRADWCEACKELEKHTYPHPRFLAEAGRFVLLQLDVTRESDVNDALLEKYSVVGLPAVRFVSADGSVLREPRLDGFVPADRMVEIMRRVP